MANGSGATVFYREVDNAIARNPPDVGDLHVLRNLCIAVDAGNASAVSQLTRDLTKLLGFEDPLHDISYELFHALMARVLLKGWFEEFDLLMDWQQTLFGTKDKRAADNWEGILKIVTMEPQSVGLLTRSNHEKEWQRALNGLKAAIRHFAKVRLPTPSSLGAPPKDPEYHERVLPEQLGDAIEQFFRVLQMLFQQMLELALARLERDGNDADGLWKLQGLQEALFKVLPEEKEPPDDKLNRVLFKTIRVVEVRYGRRRSNVHRFLDAFRPHAARSVIFNSLDREDKDEPYVRGEMLRSIQVARDRQLGFYLATYGHPWKPREPLTESLVRRRTLINTKYKGQLKLTANDDFVAFLSHYYEDRLAELTAPRANALSKAQAGARAWRDTVDLWSVFLSQMCSHSRLNLTESPPNYLTHTFPRNIAGHLLHDCGVYAVRGMYTLLSVLNRINGLHSGAAGTVNARWVRLPLHVGLMVKSDFGLVVQHNEHAFAIDDDELPGIMEGWRRKRLELEPPVIDLDPSDPDSLTLKFHEDIAANGFSVDLDMPLTSTPVLLAGEAATTRTIWSSYQKKVVPSQMFTNLVGAPNAPQYQFDIRYLRLSELEREWYNQYVVPFWNKACNSIWDKWKATLTDQKLNARATALAQKKQLYIRELHTALDIVEDSYEAQILPKKQQLSADLRADKKLLLPRVRIVAAARLDADLPVVEKIGAHVNEISDIKFKFPPNFVPPFAKRDEALLEIP